MNKGSVLVCFGYHVQSTRIGIVSTPVIDPNTGTLFSSVLAITYRVPVLGSMTGVDTMPSSVNAVTPVHPCTVPGTVVIPAAGLIKTNLPKWLRVDARIVVCIKRINAVMLCGHIDHVMRSAARYGNIRQVQRLPHHDPVDTL